jgi:chemotaxis protein MotB
MSLSDRPILIKKIKKVSGGGHHGGAWKVAYADFVTAMMAFFLLMWLINTTDPEQKKGIAEYFAPASVSATTSGSGGILGGTSLGEDGSKSEGSQSAITELAPEAPSDAPQEVGQNANLAAASEEALRDEIARREAAEFASAAESLRQAMQSMPELAELSKQLIIDQTPADPACRPGGPFDVRSDLSPSERPRPVAAADHLAGHQPAAQPHLDYRPHLGPARFEPGHPAE